MVVEFIICLLQALSRRIHYGKFVAEVKFREAPDDYTPAIQAKVFSWHNLFQIELKTSSATQSLVTSCLEHGWDNLRLTNRQHLELGHTIICVVMFAGQGCSDEAVDI